MAQVIENSHCSSDCAYSHTFTDGCAYKDKTGADVMKAVTGSSDATLAGSEDEAPQRTGYLREMLEQAQEDTDVPLVINLTQEEFDLLNAHNSAGLNQTPEAVHHPLHYGGDTVYEAIKVIEAWGLGFNLGNAAKYISRAGKKDPAKTLEDLEKAKFYLDREIANLNAKLKKEATH